MSAALVWHMSPKSSSAGQPAQYLRDGQSSAARPATACRKQSFCRLAFYNIGWNATDKKRTPKTLAKLVSTICRKKTVDAFGISEVFNIDSNDTLRRQEIMNLILDELNAERAAQPVWTGKADVHYIFVWNTNALTCVLHEVISCGIDEQAYGIAQYLQFVKSLREDTLHVFHNHSPS